VKEPWQSAWTVDGTVGWATPSYAIVMVFPAVNPVPDMVVVANPCVDDRVIDGLEVTGVVQAEATANIVKASTRVAHIMIIFFTVNFIFSFSFVFNHAAHDIY
jgi:hypothetical protein